MDRGKGYDHSSAVGISKPDERIFHMVCESGLYVGDSYENDVIGAKKAGWDVIWLNKYGQQELIKKLILPRGMKENCNHSYTISLILMEAVCVNECGQLS